MIDRGWAIVATDYPGVGTAGRYPYLIGAGEGQATLDGLRALRQVDDAHASNRVMLWGHSQGGHATLWAAQIAADYAPDLDVVGVAALSSATDPLAVSKLIIEGPASALVNAVTSYVGTVEGLVVAGADAVEGERHGGDHASHGRHVTPHDRHSAGVGMAPARAAFATT